MIQLDPAIPLETPRGRGWAHLVSDCGVDYPLIWTVFLDSGQIWQFQNHEVRAVRNITMGRTNPEKPGDRRENLVPPLRNPTIDPAG